MIAKIQEEIARREQEIEEVSEQLQKKSAECEVLATCSARFVALLRDISRSVPDHASDDLDGYISALEAALRCVINHQWVCVHVRVQLRPLFYPSPCRCTDDG
jgi:hypothetical protein